MTKASCVTPVTETCPRRRYQFPATFERGNDMPAPNVIIKQADPQPGPATGSIYDSNQPATQTPIAVNGPPWSVYLPPGTYFFLGSASTNGPLGAVSVVDGAGKPLGSGTWTIDAAKRVAGVQVHFVVE